MCIRLFFFCLLYDISFSFFFIDACIFVENLVSLYPSSCFNGNVSHHSERTSSDSVARFEKIVPEFLSCRATPAAAMWAERAKSGLESKPQASRWNSFPKTVLATPMFCIGHQTTGSF